MLWATFGLLAILVAFIGYWLSNARHGASPEWEQASEYEPVEPERVEIEDKAESSCWYGGALYCPGKSFHPLS